MSSLGLLLSDLRQLLLLGLFLGFLTLRDVLLTLVELSLTGLAPLFQHVSIGAFFFITTGTWLSLGALKRFPRGSIASLACNDEYRNKGTPFYLGSNSIEGASAGKRRFLLHDSDFRAKFRIVLHIF